MATAVTFDIKCATLDLTVYIRTLVHSLILFNILVMRTHLKISGNTLRKFRTENHYTKRVLRPSIDLYT